MALAPIMDEPGGGSGSGDYWGGTTSYGGTSRVVVIDATTFDLVTPLATLVSAINTGGTWTGTVYSSTGTGYSTGSSHWAYGAFGGDQGYPQTVAYHQQRRVFATSAGQPQTVWMSRIGNFLDFGVSSPILDDDAVTFTLNSGQLNAIRGMLSLRKLLLLTTDNEWVVGSGNSPTITPSAFQVDVQGYRGASKLVPIGVGNVALYVQSKGQVVRDIGYEFASDSFTGNDLTVMASHLVAGRQITDWSYQQAPFSCLWAVRDDGLLLGASYMREQQVIGWHRHDTLGKFESVCVIPEGDEDVLYAVVERTIDGQTKRFVERMETRFYQDIRDAFFVDCGLTFDGRTGYRGTATDHTATTMTVSGGTEWGNTEVLTLTSSVPFFNHPGTSDEGDQIVFEDADGVLYRLTIQSVTSTTVANVAPNRTLPVAYRNAARTDWYVARNSISGLGHLEGETVAIFADGMEQPQQTVISGAVTLNPPAFVAHFGLPYDSDIQTLEVMDNTQGISIGKKKSIPSASVMVEEARTIYAGRDFDHLELQRPAAPVIYDAMPPAQSGVIKLSFPTPWAVDGSMCIRNSSPTPITILGLIPDISVGG